MNQFDQTAMIAKERQAELLREAEQYRLVHEALNGRAPKTSRMRKFLAWAGKELRATGYSLEIRFGDAQETRTSMKPQTNAGGCS